MGFDLEGKPELATRPDIGCLVAGWFWQTRKLNEIADKAAEEAKKIADDALKTAEKVERDLPPSACAKSGPAAYGMTAARDTFSYSLSMKRDGKKIDVVFDDTNAPSGLVELFQKHIEP